MSITYLEAIREAQFEALRENPNVFLYGQDISTFGGAFKATKNLSREFPGRVFDAPISEDAMVGSAIDASVIALSGGVLRAVATEDGDPLDVAHRAGEKPVLFPHE